MKRDVKIFSSKFSKDLTEKICQKYDGDPINNLKLTRFSDNEFITKIDDTVRGCDVFVISACPSSPESIWEMLMISDALKRASASKIIGVFAYLPYSRQDKKNEAREPIAAKLLADTLQVAGYDRIVTIDVHAEQIQGFYDIPVDHLSANYIFVPHIKQLNLENLVFASPDAGGGKRAEKFAQMFDTDLVMCHKTRKVANQVSAMKLIGDVAGKNVILIDDLIDTAGTICKAADLMMECGALSVRAVITHPVLSGKAYENIENSRLLELITTDSIPIKQKLNKITVLSVDEMLAKAIKNINNNDSISQVFDLKK